MVSTESSIVPAPSIIGGTTMEHYAGIGVSLESVSICVVDGSGRIVREAKLASEPVPVIAWFRALDVLPAPIGLEAGPLETLAGPELGSLAQAVNIWQRTK